MSAQPELDLPVIPGVTVRAYAGAPDIPLLLAVHDACRERDRIDPHSVCYRLPNASPAQYAERVSRADLTILAFAGEEPIAQGRMEVWGIEDCCYLWRVWIVPEWRNRGIGTALHRWGEAEARRRHGDDPRTALHLANATEHETDAVRLLTDAGYYLSFVSPELAFDDFASLPPPASVPGISIRTLQRDDSVAVARALSEANLDLSRWNGEALQERISQEQDEWTERIDQADAALSFVAWEDDVVVGAYLCARRGDVGEIAQVAVRVPWRGRGIARALAMHSLAALRDAGCVTARLFTSIGPDDTEPVTGPYAMYRKFGFYPIARHLRFRKAMIGPDAAPPTPQ